MSTWIFFFGYLAGALTILSVVSLPRPKPRAVQMVAPSLPPMNIATKYRRARELGDRW